MLLAEKRVSAAQDTVSISVYLQGSVRKREVMRTRNIKEVSRTAQIATAWKQDQKCATTPN